jgi:hypothetical protein
MRQGRPQGGGIIAEDLQHLLGIVRQQRQIETKRRGSAPSRWITQLTQDLAGGFEQADLTVTSGRGARRQPIFRKFVGCIIGTLPVRQYTEHSDPQLTDHIDFALKARSAELDSKKSG